MRIATRNSLGWFDTEEEALQEIAEHIQSVGIRKAGGIALHHTTSDADELLASDQDLVRLALGRLPRQRSA